MIPEDNSVESIKVREQIIRDFYRLLSGVEGKESFTTQVQSVT